MAKSNLPHLDIIDLMTEPRLLGRWFEGPTWEAWKVFLCVLFALHDRLDEAGLAIYRMATGRIALPTAPIRKVFVCVGRRGGKSIIAALIAIYLVFFRDYAPYLALGELVTISILAADHRQARVIMRFFRGFVMAVAMFQKAVVRETRESMEFAHRVVVEVHTCSSKLVRGYTLGGCFNDEICYWPMGEDLAESDDRIVEAQLPALATIPNSLLCCISSPGPRVGQMWKAYEHHFGNEASPALFWKAASRCLPGQAGVEMNPGLDQKTVEDAYMADPQVAAADYGAEFRSDIERLFTLEALDACTDYDRPLILPPDFSDEVMQ
jgi:hypothetical protein